jgi:hemerythrin
MVTKPVAWNGSMETGILWQDMQHKTLIENINSLYEAIMLREGQDQLDRMTDFLDSYATHHFSIEERYMQTYNDPNYAQHVSEHRQFRDAVQDLKNHPAAMGELSAKSLCFDLFEWIEKHIMKTDRTMADCIRAASST